MVQSADPWPWNSYRAMVGQEPAPAWLETDWILGRFAQERARAQAGYAAFIRQGSEQPSIWEGLRHQVWLGHEAFVQRHRAPARLPKRLREAPRAQRRPLAQPLADFARRYPGRREAMAHAFQTGVYTMREIADCFGVHYATVSRAVRRLEISEVDLPTPPENA